MLTKWHTQNTQHFFISPHINTHFDTTSHTQPFPNIKIKNKSLIKQKKFAQKKKKQKK